MPVIFQVPYRTHCFDDGAILETVQALYCTVLLSVV